MGDARAHSGRRRRCNRRLRRLFLSRFPVRRRHPDQPLEKARPRSEVSRQDLFGNTRETGREIKSEEQHVFSKGYLGKLQAGEAVIVLPEGWVHGQVSAFAPPEPAGDPAPDRPPAPVGGE